MVRALSNFVLVAVSTLVDISHNAEPFTGFFTTEYTEYTEHTEGIDGRVDTERQQGEMGGLMAPRAKGIHIPIGGGVA